MSSRHGAACADSEAVAYEGTPSSSAGGERRVQSGQAGDAAAGPREGGCWAAGLCRDQGEGEEETHGRRQSRRDSCRIVAGGVADGDRNSEAWSRNRESAVCPGSDMWLEMHAETRGHSVHAGDAEVKRVFEKVGSQETSMSRTHLGPQKSRFRPPPRPCL